MIDLHEGVRGICVFFFTLHFRMNRMMRKITYESTIPECGSTFSKVGSFTGGVNS